MRASQLSTARMPSPSPAAHDDHQDSLVFGRYRLGRCLGAGSFGTVWRARDEHLDRDVAVKVVPRERVLDARFAREARAAARLSHPAIVTLYEAAADDQAAYLVSELVRGPTLDKLLEQGRLSDHDIARIGVALCEALDHAHVQGVIHRDVKPSNILIPARPASTSFLAKLTDFGIAQIVGGDSLTKTGDIVGTDAYMAPEQAAGREATPAADLYALALVLYEALTGVNPVAGIRRGARLGAHLPPLRRQRRDLPRELGRGIDLALRPRPRERGTILDLRSALMIALEELSDVRGVVDDPWRPGLARAERSEAPEPTEPGPARRRVRPAAVPARWEARGLQSACAAVLAAWLAAHTLGSAPFAPATAGLVAAALVLVLPRVGFGAVAGLLVAGAALSGHPGAALVVLIAALIPALLLPADGTAWPLAAAAPLLGVMGLAGAWPALAAWAQTAPRRAALGAVGWLWLALAAPLTGRGLYVARPKGTPGWSVWSPSPYEAVHHVLGPLLSVGVIAPAVVWAVAAATLPWLLGGRSLALDAARVLGWSLLVVSCTGTALHLGTGTRIVSEDTAVLGAVAAALVAIGPSLVAAWRLKPRSEVTRAGLP